MPARPSPRLAVPAGRRLSLRPAALAIVLAVAETSGCSAGVAARTTGGPELPVSATALIPTTTTTTPTTTPTTVMTTMTAAPTTTPAPPPAVPRAAWPPPPPPPPPASPARAGNRVLVIGDSVLLAAREALPAAMPGWAVTVDAAESRTIAAFAGVLAARGGPASFRAVVVHLCTNYSRGGGFTRSLERAMAALAGVPQVVWVTCVEWSAGPPEANEAIRAARSRYANVAVGDWAVIARQPGFTWSDGIHLRPEGQRAAAAVVATAVGPA